MTAPKFMRGKRALTCATWAVTSVCAMAAPQDVQNADTAWQRWVQLDSAAVSAYAPLLPSEQITASQLVDGGQRPHDGVRQ